MKKTLKYLLSLTVAALALVLGTLSTDACAANNGPAKGEFENSNLTVTSSNSVQTVLYGSDSYLDFFMDDIGTLEDACYDLKTNTLTLNNSHYSGINASMMGDDFKIKLVGDNTLDFIYSWGNGYGGSVTFTGTGSLTLNNLSMPLYIDASSSDSSFCFTDSVTVSAPNVDQDSPAVYVSQTTAKSPVIIEKGLTAIGSAIKESAASPAFDGTLGCSVAPVNKDGKTYNLTTDFDTMDSVIYDMKNKLVEKFSSDDSLADHGYEWEDNGVYSYSYGYKNTFIVSPTAQPAISAPKASAKVTGNKVKISVKKTDGAEGYEVKLTRLYEDLFGDKYVTIKTLKKSGEKKRKLTVKNLKSGKYGATVVPYKTVGQERVYGNSSKTVYFEVK